MTHRAARSCLIASCARLSFGASAVRYGHEKASGMAFLSRRPFLNALLGAGAISLCAPRAVRAADYNRFISASDGIRLHMIEAGPASAPSILFVPGWCMPAWIWDRQLTFFSRRFHVAALDPRGQGESDIPSTGYDPWRRGQDIADAIAQIGGNTGAGVLLVGWSLGVLDVLAYLHEHGDSHIAGLVLIDNSIGENPAPGAASGKRHGGRKTHPLNRQASMQAFVRSMFHKPQSTAFLEQLTQDALHTPPDVAAALLRYPVPRTYWKEAVYATAKPVLYAVRPAFEGQAMNLAARHPNAEISIFRTAGHALFIDEADQFNRLMESFITRKVWPRTVLK
ncbi:Epoxide hydrolase [Granulibacter bethesdensis CGDNIH4]|nr:Epoxide hydrolase [Granulibacter bethesdensis CGDNIH4]